MRRTKKALSLFFALALTFSLLTACTQPQESSEPTPEQVTFIDSAGRAVEVDSAIERVAPSGTMAQIMLYTLCPEKLVGLGAPFSEEQALYIDDVYVNLPVFGVFYGKNANLNVESLMAADPQVIIDIGDVKDSTVEDMDALQEQTGIPTVFIESTLTKSAMAYRQLGTLLGCEDRAEELATYCETTLQTTEDIIATIPAEDRYTVYYGDGVTGLEAVSAGTIHSEILDVLGLTNVCDLGNTKNTEISIEDLLSWNPDIIILVTPEAYEEALTSPLWAELDAVKNGRVYQTPAAPYNWSGRPPAVNRFLGIRWLSNLVYPELFDYDMVEEGQTFYILFYHYDLTEEEAKELLATSTFAS